jgi:hypothetical protein
MENLNHVPKEFLDKVKKILNRKESLERQIKEGQSAQHAATVEQMQTDLENTTRLLSKLLLEYNLEMSQVSGYAERGRQAPLGESRVDLNGKQTRHEAGWMEKLYSVIARANMCSALHFGGRRGDKDDMGQMAIFGKAMNIELVCYFVDQVSEKIRDMCSIAWKQYFGAEKRNTFRRGFFRGAVDGIKSQLITEEQMLPPSSSMGLMVINNRKEIELYIQQRYKLKFVSSKPLSGRSGYQQGLDAGSKMSMNKGIGGTGQKQLGQ